MRMKMNTRYVGIVLIILSIALFLIMYNFSATMIEIIDSGEIGSCMAYETCPHVTVLNQAYLGYVLAVVIFIIGLFMVAMGGEPLKPVPSEGNRERWESVMKTLTGEEKGVYERVTASGGGGDVPERPGRAVGLREGQGVAHPRQDGGARHSREAQAWHDQCRRA